MKRYKLINQYAAGFFCGLMLAASTINVPAEPGLSLTFAANGFDCSLDADSSENPWVLEHSNDAARWRSLVFLESTGSIFSAHIPRSILPRADAQHGFFRAVRLQRDHDLLRRLLDETAKWRRAGIRSYNYALRLNRGMMSWRGTVEVRAGLVTSFSTTSLEPPFVSVPEIPSIEDLFGRVEEAINSDAHTVSVTWDPGNGMPVSCFIDPDALLTDEEMSWTIESLNWDGGLGGPAK